MEDQPFPWYDLIKPKPPSFPYLGLVKGNSF